MARVTFLLLALGAVLFGCKKSDEAPSTFPPAGAAPEAPVTDAEKSAPADEAPAFHNMEEAQAALAKAEQELLALQGGPPTAAGAPAASAPAGGEGAPAPAAEAAPAPAPERKDDQTSASRCPNMCRAFGSLSRAAEAICRLAGEADERCTRARGSVRANFQRIAGCRCPAP
jgi:hypothetical protein